MARKILLADDSVTAQNMGRKILADAGYEVITVNNGSAALKKIGEQHPDLIVLDVYMPGYSGLEVCQRLKEAGDTAQIPILLTVGKLEPFKPEEVRRVRADGFIVKPFEASELLSALSKLEDRIVPRSEPSKPGRFARATAAIDEGRYDKHAAVEEESGWKNRIRFPSSKKEKGKDVQPEPDEAAVYSTGNKDLRTVIEHKIAESPANGREKEKEEDRVDLGALAPIGLPKDVTPEEIAALAAAAAQMQGKIAESKVSELEREVAPAPITELSKPESKEDLRSETPVPPVAAAVTEQKADEQAEARSAEPAAAGSFASSEPASHSAACESSADEPVTMAVGGSASDTVHASRWTAVSVALAPEDAAISLEEEMQKAYTAFAAAETGHAGNTPSSIESALATPSSTPVENASSEPVVSVPASVAPEAVQALSAVASAATEAMSAAAEQLQAVAASYVEPKEPSASVVADPAATSAPVEAVAEQKSEAAIPQAEAENATIEQQPEPSTTDSRADESKDAPHADVSAQAAAEISAQPAAGSVASGTESAPAAAAQAAEAPIEKESDMAASTAAAWANWRQSHEPDSSAPVASAQELAAKAVAAGFESSPEEVTADNGSDLASIVDSVLADLRPRIVEEISRKLGKKK